MPASFLGNVRSRPSIQKNRRQISFRLASSRGLFYIVEVVMKASASAVPVSQSSERPVWITGAGGLIGNYLVRTAQAYAPPFRIIPLTRKNLDLTNINAVQQAFTKQKPQLILHCTPRSAKAPLVRPTPALAQSSTWKSLAHLALLAAEYSVLLLLVRPRLR